MQLSEDEEQKYEHLPAQAEDLDGKIKKEKKSKKDKKKKKRKHRQIEEEGDGAVDNMEELAGLDNEGLRNLSEEQIQKSLKILEEKNEVKDGDNDYKENDMEEIDDQIEKIDE